MDGVSSLFPFFPTQGTRDSDDGFWRAGLCPCSASLLTVSWDEQGSVRLIEMAATSDEDDERIPLLLSVATVKLQFSRTVIWDRNQQRMESSVCRAKLSTCTEVGTRVKCKSLRCTVTTNLKLF